MKKYTKGSTTATIVGIVIVLLIIAGIYHYSSPVAAPVITDTSTVSSSTTPIVATTSAPTSTTNPNTTTVTSAPPAATPPATAESVSMQQYTDASFGFSFWYPGTWKVTKVSPDAKSDSNITEGKILNTLVIGPKDAAGNTIPKFTIQEVDSISQRITDSYGTDMNPTYFFTSSTHTWMTVQTSSSNPSGLVVAANVSSDTMGGLHMLGGSGDYDQATIIPLSAQNFVVVNALGALDQHDLAATVVATDPSVAEVYPQAQQQQLIQAALKAYATTTPITWKTYTDSTDKFSIQYPTSFGDASFGDLNAGVPNFYITSTSTNINSNGCYVSEGENGKVDPGVQVSLNGVTFCHSTGSDVGAGQSYRSDYYTTFRNSSHITVDYTIHTPNGCGVFQGDPKYLSCTYFFNNYSTIISAPIQQSLATFKFIN